MQSAGFSSLTPELLLHVANFLPAQDLLQFQSVSREIARLDTERLWKDLCVRRWRPWPRYQLTEKRLETLNTEMPNSTWKDRYRTIEIQATTMKLKLEDLQQLDWYLSFVLSGVRGEARTDFFPVSFTSDGVLRCPGYPPLPYEIREEGPPNSPSRLRANQRGDQPFSISQWLWINDFPPHFITRKQSSAEWLIVNENVTFVSHSKT